VVPIFPELRPYLNAAWDEAERLQTEPDSKPREFVIVKHRNPPPVLRRQLERIIKAAGLKRWPKLWQNLRSTRKTELSESFPMHVVCQWIGNSEAVAKQHYLQVTEDQMARAVSSSGSNPAAADLSRPPQRPDTKPVRRAAFALQSGQKLCEMDRNERADAPTIQSTKNPGKHGKMADFPGFLGSLSGHVKWALRDSKLLAGTLGKPCFLKPVAPPVAPLPTMAIQWPG
jgi:hypothetical protein